MSEETTYEAECWSCGERPAYECSDCEDGEEYCGNCMAEHDANLHDDEDSA